MSLPFFKSFYLYLEQTGGSHEQTKSFPICKQSNDGVNSDPPQKKPHDVIILYLFIVFSIYVYKYKKSMFLEWQNFGFWWRGSTWEGTFKVTSSSC